MKLKTHKNFNELVFILTNLYYQPHHKSFEIARELFNESKRTDKTVEELLFERAEKEGWESKF